MATSLALIGCKPEALTHCLIHLAETKTILIIQEIYTNADWKLWGSLDYLLPTIAEAASNEFIKYVEDALQQSPCPFDELFQQDDSGINGSNYLTGLLWALETLAWDQHLLNHIYII